MVNPCGSSEPLSFTEELVRLVARLVVTTGGPVAVSVVKVLSSPYLVPALLEIGLIAVADRAERRGMP